MTKHLFSGLCISFLLLATGTIVHAQNITIQGTVKDAETNEALSGVTISVVGTTIGTLTNEQGAFELTVPSENETLVISYLGYQTKKVPLNGQTTLDITIHKATLTIDELVVTGYQVKRKGELTGAISQIQGEEVAKTPTPNILRSLQGKMAGLKIDDRGGQPGAENMNILIRGQETFGENTPLVIIDGVPSTVSHLSSLSPSDIADVNVLKDASAAIYGARAANGVIVVETKRGKSETSRITIDANTGFSTYTQIPKMMNSFQNATYQNEMEARYGRNLTFSEEDLKLYKNGSKPLTHPNTDWYALTLKKYTPQSRVNISAQGGTKKVRYYISGNYNHQGSLWQGDDMYYNKYQIRSNIDAQVMQYLNVGFDVSGGVRDVHQTAMPAGDLFHRVQLSRPMDVGVYPNGLPGYAAVGLNPVVGATDKAGWNDTKEKIFNSKLSADLNMDWLTKGLNLKGIAAIDYNINDNKLFKNVWDLYKYRPQTGEYERLDGKLDENQTYRSLDQSNIINQQKYFNVSLNYRRSFGDHNINAFIAYEVQETDTSNLTGYRRDLIDDQKVYLDLAGTKNQSTGGIASNSGRVSYFASISYNYKRTYLLDFTLRRDGSFNFPVQGRWGTFPSVSLGWTISNEAFMASTDQWLDNLKIRASYGLMGNDQVPSYQYLTKYELSSSSGYYIFGESRDRYDGFSQTNTPNPAITWEVAKNFDVGLDAVLFDNKLTLTLDYFYDKRRKILIRRSGGIPDYTGISLPQQNLGKIDNQGVEVVAGYLHTAGDWTYNVGGNFSFNKNKIVFMSEPKNIPDYQKQTGHPINSYLFYKSDGIFHTQKEIDNTNAILEGTLPGDIKYVDVNGDGAIDGLDRVRLYSSPIPEIQYGINAGVSYKTISLSIFLQGQAKAKTQIYNDRGAESNEPEYYFTERWTKDNPNADFPRAMDRDDFYNISHMSNFWLYNAAFLRLKNVALSYSLSPQLLSKTPLEEVMIYLRGYNLWTWAAMDKRMGGKYFDPENDNSSKYYPQEKSFVVGLSIQF